MEYGSTQNLGLPYLVRRTPTPESSRAKTANLTRVLQCRVIDFCRLFDEKASSLQVVIQIDHFTHYQLIDQILDSIFNIVIDTVNIWVLVLQ